MADAETSLFHGNLGTKEGLVLGDLVHPNRERAPDRQPPGGFDVCAIMLVSRTEIAIEDRDLEAGHEPLSDAVTFSFQMPIWVRW